MPSVPLPTAFVPPGIALIRGTGEMAEAIRTRNWAETPLGPIERWSATLVATVNILLLSPFPFALYWGDTLTLLYNDAYRPFLGEKHPGALGAPGPAIWQEAWAIIGPPIEAASTQGTATSATESFIPVLIEGALQDRWWTYGFYPIYENDCIAGVANPGSDDTPAILARHARQEAEQVRIRLTSQLEQILDGTVDGIALVNRAWEITYFNKAGRKLAQVDSSILGRNIWEAFPGMAYENSPYVRHHTRAMNEGIAGNFTTAATTLGITDLHVFSLPVPDGIVIIFRDITEQTRNAQALIQTEKLAAVGKLASSVAHEINNPLEAVTNLLYLVQRSNNLDEIHSFIDTAERELRRVSLIANQTLRFHKQPTSPTSANCNDMIGDSLSIYQGRLVNANITVEKRKRARHPVECFDGEIRQVLSNLIGNAIDAMPNGGRLLLRSREALSPHSGERGLVLTVADTGTGISRGIRHNIFDAFFTTKGISGTGLGLWISNEIVHRHNGHLHLRSSQHPTHRGTVFTIFLPFHAVTR